MAPTPPVIFIKTRIILLLVDDFVRVQKDDTTVFGIKLVPFSFSMSNPRVTVEKAEKFVFSKKINVFYEVEYESAHFIKKKIDKNSIK